MDLLLAWLNTWLCSLRIRWIKLSVIVQVFVSISTYSLTNTHNDSCARNSFWPWTFRQSLVLEFDSCLGRWVSNNGGCGTQKCPTLSLAFPRSSLDFGSSRKSTVLGISSFIHRFSLQKRGASIKEGRMFLSFSHSHSWGTRFCDCDHCWHSGREKNGAIRWIWAWLRSSVRSLLSHFVIKFHLMVARLTSLSPLLLPSK